MIVSSFSGDKIELQPYPVDKLADNSMTDFDLFIQVSNHLVLYGGAGYKWFRSELEGLLANGFDHLLMKAEDKYKVEMYEKLCRLPLIEREQAPKQRIKSIEQIGASFMEYLHKGEITQACVEKSKLIIKAMLDCIAEDRSCIKELTGLGDYDFYTYSHSVRAAAYILAVAIQMGQRNENLLTELGVGGMFHDLGKKQIPLTVINKVGALTKEEWEQMQSHPRRGFETVQNTILTHLPREIVLHHHEKLDGSGYPDGLDKISLLPEVQIATLADVFDALTSTRSYQQKRSRYEALDFIRHNMLGIKISNEAYQALITSLAA